LHYLSLLGGDLRGTDAVRQWVQRHRRCHRLVTHDGTLRVRTLQLTESFELDVEIAATRWCRTSAGHHRARAEAVGRARAVTSEVDRRRRPRRLVAMVTPDVGVEQRPIDILVRWLRDEWDGPYVFTDVRVDRHETADGSAEACYIFPVIKGGPDTDFDAADLSEVDIAVRDKAMELGLEYPWFVFVQVSDPDEPMEDDDPDPVG
jgi:hypothetical protein